ncbi:hypothetical protein DN752_08490 [Echinicola strongylocentroti]|uniref:DUF4365 domain-containing protein n=1 Tax=Echinicola strongylocentroti TaxID=1795355 RepID=A0A2Z4IGV3_9BACT|nr:DUF4365 domain-containing protein [Echinicola strongylocentroti]AWW30155.1 hypothetical protein DN752_08490 [Echinicola strongylocentroti]
MAFDENPIVDDNSKNSEESVLFVKSIFSQRNGFICRTDHPDFGVDQLVELLKFDGDSSTYNQATNKRFVLQLKSIEKISEDKIMEKSGENFIKISFKSSRLKYLLEFAPAYGLIILYDAFSKKAYFDYAEEIYKNLNDFHQGESWKEKKQPTIYIPLNNELSLDSLKIIHDFFSNRHENAESLILNHGQSYNIPSFRKPSTKDFDFRNPQDVKKVLVEYGWSLIDDNDLNFVDSMLSVLSYHELLNDPRLCLLKATVSCEIGNHFDADFFLSKYDQLSHAADSDLSRKIFLRNKIDFILGKVDYSEFIINLTELSKNISDSYNKLLIEINITFISFLKKISSVSTNSDSFELIVGLFKKIESSEIEVKKKHYLKIYHISNLVVFVTDYVRKKLSKFKVKESMGVNVPIHERGQEVRDIISKIEFFKKLTFETWEYGSKIEDKFLVASSMYNFTNYQFIFNFNIALLSWNNIAEKVGDKEEFTKYINLAFSAYKMFFDIAKIHQAYLSLILAHELTLLYKVLRGETIKNDPEKIEINIREIEIKMEYNSFQSVVMESIPLLKREKKPVDLAFQEIDESNIDYFVDTLCDSMGLPDDRKKYIRSDIAASKQFYKERKSEKLELLQDLSHTKSISTHYKYPLIYSIQCQKCKVRTPWRNDVNQLLKLMESHKC